MYSQTIRAKEMALAECGSVDHPQFLDAFARAVQRLVIDQCTELVDEIQRNKLREGKYIASQTCGELAAIIEGRLA